MADLGYTDAQWLRFLGAEIGSTFLAPTRLLREVRDRFRRERTQYVVWQDTRSSFIKTSHATPITLSGVDLGSNTTADGKLYARITGSGPYTVTLYKATGGSASVCTGSANADAAVTLAEANSSGMTGTWQLPASVSTTTDDSLEVVVFQDYTARLNKAYTADGTVEDDAHSRQVLTEAYASVAATIQGAISTLMTTALSRYGLSDGSNNLTSRGNAFLESAESALITDVSEEDSDGNVSRKRGGLFETALQAMADETTGSTQYVVKRAPSAGAGSFSSGNDGAGTVSSHTPLNQCPASRWTFKCSEGADTDALGSERFDVTVYLQDGTDRSINVGTGPVVGQSWSGPYGFGPITITRTLSKTGDGSNQLLAAASSATVTGENNSNTSDGVLYGKLVANGSNWDVEFYSASSRATSTLVAKATNVASAASFTATSQNASGLTVAWTLGGTESANSSWTLDLQPFYAENTSGVPDQFTVTVTVASEGLIQTILAEELDPPARLNSTTSGSETIDDGYAKHSTFFPFIIADN